MGSDRKAGATKAVPEDPPIPIAPEIFVFENHEVSARVITSDF